MLFKLSKSPNRDRNMLLKVTILLLFERTTGVTNEAKRKMQQARIRKMQ